MKCWGLDGSGQLGNGPPLADALTPQTVAGLTGVTHLAAGGFHTLRAASGRHREVLGPGRLRPARRRQPRRLRHDAAAGAGLPAGDPVVAISGGESHTCAATQAGKLWCWGHNGFGQLGDNVASTT